jgi:hypothetical protein
MARRAKDEGFATLLIRDHFIAEPFGHQLAPLTTLALRINRREPGNPKIAWHGSEMAAPAAAGHARNFRPPVILSMVLRSA